MTIELKFHRETWGLAVWYDGPDPHPNAPPFLKTHSITIIFFNLVMGVSWL